MNIEEALEIINVELPYTSDIIEEALSLIADCVDKQIPKKPLDICTPCVTWGLCPTCKGELTELGGRPNRVFVNMAYCPDCGQKLDWEGIENVESK